MLTYKITINKDHNTVAVHYDISGHPLEETIAVFSVYIDGKDVITEDASNNTKFFGTVFAKINEAKDIPVAFSLTGSADFSASGDDVLRGGHPFEDAEFSN